MKILVSILFFTLCTAVSSQSDSTTDTTVITETTTVVTESTVPTTETSVTTEEPTTVTASSTDVSSTTGQPATTSSPVTTESPDFKKCSWNTTCVRADLKVQFFIPIEGRNTSLNIKVRCDAKAESDCSSSNTTQTLSLVEANQYNLTLVFEKEGGKVFVSNITLDYFLSAEERGSVANNDKHFDVKTGSSYLCRSETDIKLDNATMEISDVQIQAFGEKENFQFGSVDECEADEKVSPILPIAVGVSLAALIIIVLIAYLVGRRRSRQRGYQSV